MHPWIIAQIHESSAYLPTFMKSKMPLNKWAHLHILKGSHCRQLDIFQLKNEGTYSWLLQHFCAVNNLLVSKGANGQPKVLRIGCVQYNYETKFRVA